MNFETLQPIYDRILAKRIVEENKTRGGLFMPEASLNDKGYITAEVMACGKGKLSSDGTLRPVIVTPKNKILLLRHAGVSLDQEYLIIREDEILGIIG